MKTPTPIHRIAISAGFARSLILFRGPLLRALRRKGVGIVAIAPDGGPGVRDELAGWGVSFEAVRLKRAEVGPAQDLLYTLQMFRILRRNRPDAYLGYTIKPVIFGGLAARMARVPNRFAMITGLGFAFQKEGWLGRVVRMLYRAALSSCQRVIFQNPDDVQDFVSRGIVDPSRVMLVDGSGVDLDHYAASPPAAGAPVFLLIGRLLRSKGIGEYLRAAAEIRANEPAARCLLVGDCDPNPESYQPVDTETWRREGIIEYRPHADDVRPHLRECTVYVLPSYREGTPRTVLEAMSSGRAVITTDAPGCRETVRNCRPAENAPAGVLMGDNGFLVPPRDAAALHWAMRQFILHPDLAASMGAAGRRYAAERYEADKVARDIMSAMGIA